MIYNLGCIYTYGYEAIDLAIYGFNIAPISRVRGESVAKAAAYILRANIADPYLGMTHYYAYGKDLLYSEIIIPDYAPRDFLYPRLKMQKKGMTQERGGRSGLPSPMTENFPIRNEST